MQEEISRPLAIVKMRCPRCRHGKMFQGAMYHPAKFAKMNRKCPVCGANFHPEPGFYFGAMYISYAVNIGIFVTAFLLTKIFFDPDNFWIYFSAIMVPSILLFPPNFRMSRVLMLHLFGWIKYDPEAAASAREN